MMILIVLFFLELSLSQEFGYRAYFSDVACDTVQDVSFSRMLEGECLEQESTSSKFTCDEVSRNDLMWSTSGVCDGTADYDDLYTLETCESQNMYYCGGVDDLAGEDLFPGVDLFALVAASYGTPPGENCTDELFSDFGVFPGDNSCFSWEGVSFRIEITATPDVDDTYTYEFHLTEWMDYPACALEKTNEFTGYLGDCVLVGGYKGFQFGVIHIVENAGNYVSFPPVGGREFYTCDPECQNSGVCRTDAIGCDCSGTIYEGDHCETCACQNGGVCGEVSVTACEGCPDVYGGLLCDECLCENEGVCVETEDDTFVCECVEGFEGDFCEDDTGGFEDSAGKIGLDWLLF